MSDPLVMQQLREWAEDAAADHGDVVLPGELLIALLDELDLATLEAQ